MNDGLWTPALSPSELSLRNGSAQAAIPRADIRRITTRDPDPLTNGILIGAGIGGGIAGAIGPLSNDWHPRSRVLMALMGAGIGAAIGVGGDALKKTDVVLYQAP